MVLPLTTINVDALAQDWSSDNNWLCPPAHLIVAAVKHLRYHKGVGTLIIPEWPSASFWPFLHFSPSRFHTFVKEFVVLPRLATACRFSSPRGRMVNFVKGILL